MGFWKLSPRLSKSSPRQDAACANSDELVGRVPEGKTSSLTAVLLLIPTVELTCYAGRSSSMPRSLTVCPEVDSGRSWRLCVDCTSFVSSRRAELGETRRARPIFAPLLLRVSSPPLVSHPTALLTQSPRVAAPRRRSRECHACRSSRAYRCPCVKHTSRTGAGALLKRKGTDCTPRRRGCALVSSRMSA